MFLGRKLLVATKHQKEKVIAPILEKELGVNCITATDLDTDQLGTFTGEVERKDDPISTARKKCLMAMEMVNCDLAIASEGSFGAHPNAFFIPADDELLLLIDKKNGIEIIARHLSTETNFNSREITTRKQLMEFAAQALFPTHALIIKNEKDNFKEVIKGINNLKNLEKQFDYFISVYGKAYVETDMRAMYNPTRMRVIEETTNKLIATCKSLCPQCQTPGFSVTGTSLGLPCENCGLPTQGTLSYDYTCAKCGFVKTKVFPNNKYSENPMYCSFCNP